ncbi:hypothetical protein D9M68_474390 [compost metagenome]
MTPRGQFDSEHQVLHADPRPLFSERAFPRHPVMPAAIASGERACVRLGALPQRMH